MSAVGVVVRHSRSCETKLSITMECTCSPSYEAWLFVNGKKLRQTFRTFDEAREWRERGGDHDLAPVLRRVIDARLEYQAALAAMNAYAELNGLPNHIHIPDALKGARP